MYCFLPCILSWWGSRPFREEIYSYIKLFVRCMIAWPQKVIGLLPKAREKVVDPFQNVHLNLSATATLGTNESGLYKKVASVESFIKGSQCMDYLSAKTKKVAISGGSTVVRVTGSIQVSRKLPTYPSPNPTVFPKWEVSVNVGLREG